MIEFRARVAAAQAVRAGVDLGAPFLIVTPLGDPVTLTTALAELEVTISTRVDLPRWPEASTAIHVRWSDDAGLDKAQAFEQLWARYPDRAAVWWLSGEDGYARLLAAKATLRARFAGTSLTGTSGERRFTAALFPFHVPDRIRLAEETAVVRWWLAGA